MPEHEKRPSMWAQNLALVVAMIGVFGSIVVAFISDRLRDEDQRVAERLRDEQQTLALRRVAYDEFAAAVYEYDDALDNYRRAILFYVDATLHYQANPDDPSAHDNWQQRDGELGPRNDAARDQRTEVFKAQNRLGLIGTSDAISAASELLLTCNERFFALGELHDFLVTPDVLQWTPAPELLALHESESETTDLLSKYNDKLTNYLYITQTNVRPRS